MAIVLVAGTYPPVPGRAAARTLDAVRSALDGGEDVVVLSPRPSAAHRYGTLVGWRVGWTLIRVRQSTRARVLVLCLQPGMPFEEAAGLWRRWLTRQALATAIGGFEKVVVDATESRVLERATRKSALAALRVVEEELDNRREPGGGQLFTVSGPSEWQRGMRLWFGAALLEQGATDLAHRLLGRRASTLGSGLRFLLRPLRQRLLSRTR